MNTLKRDIANLYYSIDLANRSISHLNRMISECEEKKTESSSERLVFHEASKAEAVRWLLIEEERLAVLLAQEATK